MKNIGVVEGFFGPAWKPENRKSYAEFLSAHGGEFYIYAPKQDPFLRKSWRETWPNSYVETLTSLCHHFQSFGIKFGVGLSPFGLGQSLTPEDKQHLKKKIAILNEIGIDLIGLFFDDMPSDEYLAGTQLEALEMIQRTFKKKIIFCPTYYTFDPILEKVFGKKPEGYLERIAEEAPSDVALAWTGPKVISTDIDKAHLEEVSLLLKRKPFLWENLFANDGPKNCKFLKLKSFTGRDPGTLDEIEGIAFNLMNQAELSKIVFLASKYVLEGEFFPDIAFENALIKICSTELREFIQEKKSLFLSEGLDKISEEDKKLYIEKLTQMKDPAALEIIGWLKGDYNVGSECLTD